MPFRRRAAIVRRPRRKTSAPRKFTVSRAVKKYVKRALPKIELKTFWQHDNEVSLNTLSQGTTANMYHPQLAVGNSGLQRVGNEINFKSMHLKGVLYNNSTQETYVRMIVVGCPGTLDPTITTFPLFRSGSSGVTSVVSSLNGLDQMYYPLNTMDLTVYQDNVFKLAGSNSYSGGSNTRMFSKFIKFPGKGKHVTFKGNTTGQNNQNWYINVIWLAADANDDTSTGTNVELSMLTRYWYQDV